MEQPGQRAFRTSRRRLPRADARCRGSSGVGSRAGGGRGGLVFPSPDDGRDRELHGDNGEVHAQACAWMVSAETGRSVTNLKYSHFRCHFGAVAC